MALTKTHNGGRMIVAEWILTAVISDWQMVQNLPASGPFPKAFLYQYPVQVNGPVFHIEPPTSRFASICETGLLKDMIHNSCFTHWAASHDREYKTIVSFDSSAGGHAKEMENESFFGT